jgi:branched-chain amino acid transport system substrate-binding protein
VIKRTLLSLAIALVVVGCAGDSANTPTVATYGALLDLTGPGKTLGVTSQAALALALGTDQLVVKNTQLTPATALEQLQQLHAQGIKVVFGPQSSSELAACKDFADANDMLLISMGSTASTLSIADDDVLRFCPPDTREIEAVVAYLQEQGKTGIAPVWRNDVGNTSLVTQLRSQFTAVGGTVSVGYTYAPDAIEFSVTAQNTQAQANDLRTTLGDNVAIYFGSFDEAATLASNFPQILIPGQIVIGGDGMAKAATFLAPGAAQARAFALRNNMVAPTFGLDPAQQSIWEPLTNQIRTMTGEDPDAFALAAYDSAVLAKQAVQANSSSAAAIRAGIVAAANTHIGATGLCRLDANGDRASSNFDFWGLNASPAWEVKASYRNGMNIRP